LGKETFHKVLFNRAVAAEKLKKPDDAIAVLNQLIQAAPTGPAYVLQGQMYAVKNDYKNAIETWKKALATGDSADVRDRLGRASYAAKDFAGAIEQFEAEAKLLGGTEKLSRESTEAFARARFAAGQFAAAAALYEELHRRFRDAPAYAYECGVARERDGKLPDAAKWYAIAQKAKDKLPAEYAKAVDANLANAQMQSGSEDSGASYWIESLSPQTADAAFDSALVPLRKLATAGKLARGKIETAMAAYNTGQPRYYALGALLLQGLSAESKTADVSKLATRLASEFSANESKLDPKSPGATLAPAIIHFFKAESERLAGNHADALASYETILSAYPYN
jgi:tetratricopeptide (TPR) repeat protein